MKKEFDERKKNNNKWKLATGPGLSLSDDLAGRIGTAFYLNFEPLDFADCTTPPVTNLAKWTTNLLTANLIGQISRTYPMYNMVQLRQI